MEVRKFKDDEIIHFVTDKKNQKIINHFLIGENYKISFDPKGVVDYLSEFQNELLQLEENRSLVKLSPDQISLTFSKKKEMIEMLEEVEINKENEIKIPIWILIKYLNKFQILIEDWQNF